MRRWEIPLTLTLSPKGRGKKHQLCLSPKRRGKRDQLSLSSNGQNKREQVKPSLKGRRNLKLLCLSRLPYKGKKAEMKKVPLSPPLPSRERVGVRVFLALFFSLLALPAWAQITVGVLPEDASRFQPYISQAAQAGQRVTLETFSESALYQQVYTLGTLGLARIDAAEVLTKWLPQIQGRLLDLTPYAQELQAAGVALYSYGNVVVGVRLPWRDDAFLAVLLRSRKAQEALSFLKLFLAAEAKITPLSLSVGPLVVAKAPKKTPGVDGALESFVSALRQAVPTGLVTALSAAPPQAQEALRRIAEMWGIPLSPDGASVTLVLEPTAAVAPLALGAREAQASPLGLQKVVVPLANLESFLSQIAGKARVRLPFEPVPMAATSEGVNLVGAAAFHAQGIRGAGVKIAVIDVGFAGLSQSQARGDLPYSLVTRDFTGTGIDTGLSHGTAVAEIVYDIAPAATLYLVKIANEVDLDNAVTYCISEGVHIIVHSLGWFNTSFYDGTGVIAQIVNRAANAGILWVQAAGNSGRRHYGPTFTDTNGDGWHDTDVTLSANAGDRILLYLTWDSWPQTADDYDLFLFDPAGNLVASSTKTQAGAEQPTERIFTTATVSGTYRVRIQRVSGATRRLALFSVYHDLFPFDPGLFARNSGGCGRRPFRGGHWLAKLYHRPGAALLLPGTHEGRPAKSRIFPDPTTSPPAFPTTTRSPGPPRPHPTWPV